jgi:hypothetical protein
MISFPIRKRNCCGILDRNPLGSPWQRAYTNNFVFTNCIISPDLLWAGQSGDRIPVEARFSAPVQAGPGAHPTSYTTGNGFISRGHSSFI